MICHVLRLLDQLRIVSHNAKKLDGVSGNRSSLEKAVIKEHIIVPDFFFKMIIVISLFQDMGEFNIVGGRKAEDILPLHALENFRRGRDPLYGVGAP